MKKLILISLAFILISCGPSQQERQGIAFEACRDIAANLYRDKINNFPSDELDLADYRKDRIIKAREKLGEPTFIGYSDDNIDVLTRYGLCTRLILNKYKDGDIYCAITMGPGRYKSESCEGVKIDNVWNMACNSGHSICN